jgi:hypothetical protein
MKEVAKRSAHGVGHIKPGATNFNESGLFTSDDSRRVRARELTCPIPGTLGTSRTLRTVGTLALLLSDFVALFRQQRRQAIAANQMCRANDNEAA